MCVDNSIMAPVFQQPLELGADIVMTSATKFVAGHSDVTGRAWCWCLPGLSFIVNRSTAAACGLAERALRRHLSSHVHSPQACNTLLLHILLATSSTRIRTLGS